MSIEWRPMKAKKTQDAIKGETKMMWVDYTINSLPMLESPYSYALMCYYNNI